MILVEDQSMEVFLGTLLPRLLPNEATFEIHAFQGKRDLLNKLENRLRGYQRSLPSSWRLAALVDRDDEDCHKLKARMEQMASATGLRTRSTVSGVDWQVVNRIAIEELEAWYFGDWEAVRTAYPRVRPAISRNARYRDPDAIAGGTWEAFERVLKRYGYFTTGLRKSEAARAVAAHIDHTRNRSRSFIHFCDAVIEAVA